MNALIDTNVILDFLLYREPQYEDAKKIFELTCQDKISAFTTASSITDIYYIVAKKLGSAKAKDSLRNLFNLLGIIPVDGDDCVSALDLPIIDYEDALVSACAHKTNMDFVVTNDANFISTWNVPVKVLNPTGFIRVINNTILELGG